MFTQQHYRVIAKLFKESYANLNCDPAYTDAIKSVEAGFIAYFIQDSKKFNKKMFEKAVHGSV
jgi:hypothetical protein